MDKTEAHLKVAIATLESVEQHIDLVRKAIAHDAECKQEKYHHVFNGMIKNLSDCRENLANIMKEN